MSTTTLTPEQLSQVHKLLTELNERIERVTKMIDTVFEERDALRAELRLVKGETDA